MFCYKCGHQLSDNAVFCHKCGTKIPTDTQTSSTQVKRFIPSSSGSSELDHEALKIYLRDLLSLECIKRKYINSINSLNKRIATIDTQSYSKFYTFEYPDSWSYTKNVLYFKYKNGHHYLGMIPSLLYGDHPIVTCFFAKDPYWFESNDCYYLNIEENHEKFTKLSMWTCYDIVCSNNIFSKRRLGKKAKDAFLRSYEDFKQCCSAGLQSQNIQSNKLKTYKNSIVNELNAVEKILTKAYGINVIPQSFRNNIYAIYYLYDFIRTSNQSLTTALLHYDLNEIKAKLDKIIVQQQEIIIQQSIMIARNQQILEQNQQHLKSLASIERNTAQAAQYSAIAASNAEACAWIGLANYLK